MKKKPYRRTVLDRVEKDSLGRPLHIYKKVLVNEDEMEESRKAVSDKFITALESVNKNE